MIVHRLLFSANLSVVQLLTLKDENFHISSICFELHGGGAHFTLHIGQYISLAMMLQSNGLS